jgi:hypothetical protein
MQQTQFTYVERMSEICLKKPEKRLNFLNIVQFWIKSSKNLYLNANCESFSKEFSKRQKKSTPGMCILK